MKKILLLIAVLSLFTFCKEENFLRLQISQEIQDFEPNFPTAKQFRDSTDTIFIEKLSENSAFEKVNPAGGNVGSLGEFDLVEIESRNLTVGIDTPYFRFRFSTEAQYRPDLQRRSQDVMQIFMEEENTGENLIMTFEIGDDSLRCTTPGCVFQDSLFLDSILFQDVYFLPDTFPTIFINRNQGLVGFKTASDNLFIQN